MPEGLNPFPETRDDADPEQTRKLEEIEKLKKELLDSGVLPDQIEAMLGRINAGERLNAIKTREQDKETIGVDEEQGEVRIGWERTPILPEAKDKLSWDIEGEQFREPGQTMVSLSFRRTDGLKIEPGGEPVKGKVRFEDKDRFMSLDKFRDFKKMEAKYLKMREALKSQDPEKAREAEDFIKQFKKDDPDSEYFLRALDALNRFAVKEARDVVGRDPFFVETPHVVATMEKMTGLINRQLARKQGVVILEGEAGTGKNKNVDHFAFLTRRPLFRFTCAAGKDEQDLKYLLEYDSKKGTYRIKSTVVEALETPGAILEFDEINTLKPEVAKILNSLFDHDRALFTGEDKEAVRAAEGVILIGLQNPQHYMGVKPLPETIKSRARMMEVTYPPFRELRSPDGRPSGSYLRADEAMMIRTQVRGLVNIPDQDFRALWDTLFNGNPNLKVSSSISNGLISKTQLDSLNGLKQIIEIANKIRAAYRAYHEGKADEQVKFVFSLRESIECAYELAASKVTDDERRRGITQAKKAVLQVILPKVPLGEERTFLEALINEI